MIDSNHLRFHQEGTLPAGTTRVIAQTIRFDHCNMTVGPSADPQAAGRFRDTLMGMSYADPELRPLFDLEGLKSWCDGRTEGYAPLEAAVDALSFYDREGRVSARDYRP
jgi:ABC-type phosphate/phosphonate transport system substrate-binding protein